MLDTVVISGDDVCCSVVFGSLVGECVFRVMWSELMMTSAISWSVVISVRVPEGGVCVHISGEDRGWNVCDALYARVSCL